MENNQKRTAPSEGRPVGGPGKGGPGGMAIHGGEKPKDFKGTLSKLLRYLGVYKIGIIAVMILSALATVFNILGPKILGMGTDIIYKGVEAGILTGTVAIDYWALAKVLILLAGLYVISWVFALFQGFTMTRISNNVTYNLRKDLSKKINKLPIGYYDKSSTGDVLSRITNDVDTINQSLNQSLTQMTTAITMLVGTTVVMFSISWILTLIALIVIPLSLFLIAKIVKISQPLYKKQQKSLGLVNGHIEEMLSAHTVVKSFNMEKKSVEQFQQYNDQLYQNGWKSQMMSHLMMPATDLISNLGYIMVCIGGAALTAAGSMTIGGIQSFLQYIKSFNQPMTQMANISTMLQSAVACSERVFLFLEQQEEEEDTKSPQKTDGIVGNVSFEKVDFGYNPGVHIINDFSLDVKAGEKIAIVGPTGAGKTTIVKLLMRYYELNGGKITIDGVNIRDFTRGNLRSMFGMVLQDTWLFKGSIKDNIAYSMPNATMKEIEDSAKISQVDHFVKALPQGYEFELNEESSNISQGQKQLITIARAFLQNPRILILDEATSSVDTRTEMQIQHAMERLTENRTSFVIAHRLSTIRDADKIIVMNNGKIVELGNHETLLANGGFYANLYKSQFENNPAA